MIALSSYQIIEKTTTMKKIILIAVVVLTGMSAFAQSTSGNRDGRQGPPPGVRQGQRPPQSQKGDPMLELMMLIPDLTLSQGEKLTDILTNEKKDIDKQLKKRREADEKYRYAVTEKDIEKRNKEYQKIDKKIDSIKEKSNKKVKKALSDKQYAVFIQKREEFRFRGKPMQPFGVKKERRNDVGKLPPRGQFPR